jgi:hypothetical protein
MTNEPGGDLTGTESDAFDRYIERRLDEIARQGAPDPDSPGFLSLDDLDRIADGRGSDRPLRS